MEKKQEQTINLREVENTPFMLAVKTTEEGQEVKIICGNHLCSDKVFITEEAAIWYINEKPYELIMSLFLITLTNLKLISNNKK